MAAKRVKVEVLDKLWEWAKKLLNTDELNNKLLLAKDDEENAIFHNIIYYQCKDIREIMEVG